MVLAKLIQKIRSSLPKEVYGEIWVSDLKTGELRTTGIPDEYLGMVTVEFTSDAGRKYNLLHATGDYWGKGIVWSKMPVHRRVQLYGYKLVDVQDFQSVEQKITEIVKGTLGKLISETEPWNEKISDKKYGLSRIIEINERPTQATIADFVDGYSNHFQDVRIEYTEFGNVPIPVYRNSRLYLLHKEKVALYTKSGERIN